MINNISPLNNMNIYKPQSNQKISNLSFKANSDEFSDKEKKNKKTITVLSLLLCLVSGVFWFFS